MNWSIQMKNEDEIKHPPEKSNAQNQERKEGGFEEIT